MRHLKPRCTARRGGATDGIAEVRAVADSSRLHGLYLHDDRIGPYVPATLTSGVGDCAAYILNEGPGRQSTWSLRYILMPMHAKLRLSFTGLARAANDAIIKATSFWLALAARDPSFSAISGELSYELYVARLYLYIESLVREGPSKVIEALSELVTFPRYVGVVKIRAAYSDPVDLLIDTTDTYRNVRCLAVVARGDNSEITDQLVRSLAVGYGCWPVLPDR